MRRTWLFVPGADGDAHAAAARSGADVLIQELEDFTPPGLRPKARALAAGLYDRWRSAGALAAVRVNPLETCGREDLAAVLAGRPDVVLMSKVDAPEQVRALAAAAPGVDLVPNVESAKGLLRVGEIARADPRVVALLVASEDMVADLGTTRSRGGEELAYVRQRFLLECRAAGVEAIDAPYTFSDVKGAVADAKWAARMGYRMKSLVDSAHAQPLNKVFTPDVARARRIVEAFDKARAQGKERARLDGALIEVPIYAAAKRLLDSGVQTPPPRRRRRR
ncbi:MAG: CoA ester lyase [Betaproteobacteria bacterium]|nr:CoA ester lyase [Betaproteobacteria bacterium]MDH5220986.1 CoA ester lyase [Betaproteobacteria bacterium]MDH5351674.1 CoA ester lyase [Betaproteobacteria bacterium]